MNRYVELNGKKYLVMFKDWTKVQNQPSTVRPTLLGAFDVTFAPATFDEWRGTIEVPVSGADGTWGVVADMQAALSLRASMNFIDHYGTSYAVAVIGPEFTWRSLKPMWDAGSNKFYIPIRIVRVA